MKAAMISMALLSLATWTQAASVTGDHCEKVVLNFSHAIPPIWGAEAHLDIKGKWFVPDWDALARVPELTRMPFATPGMAECMAQWLLDHRGGPDFTDHPDFSCPIDITMTDDPAVRACSPRVVCEVWDTCG